MSDFMIKGFKTNPIKTTTTSTKPKFDWMGLGLNVANIGLGIWSQQEGRKTAEAQAQALREQGLNEIEIQKIILEGKKLELEGIKAGAGKDSSINPKLLIGLGVGGVLVLGIVIFAVLRKKT